MYAKKKLTLSLAHGKVSKHYFKVIFYSVSSSKPPQKSLLLFSIFHIIIHILSLRINPLSFCFFKTNFQLPSWQIRTPKNVLISFSSIKPILRYPWNLLITISGVTTRVLSQGTPLLTECIPIPSDFSQVLFQ